MLENKKICVQNYSRIDVHFERFSVVLGLSSKASSTKFFGYKSKWKKMSLNFGPWNLSISEINRIKDSTVSIRYISINFHRNLTEKSHNSVFLRDQTQRTRNILTIFTWKNLCFTEFSTKIDWLLLTFFLCL